ncbi:uncharacterized protein KY384_004561 [Bacidia gigantensis]|uniref:uncharacterized protein n=1 Tax=Bacidia gigantensis TaxID=2732470 RepID=UPI001D05525C|nr:uncharacterized protein KY384_004561 [Bacidia gigantensis]KAG8531203.1 hypothetical protein KY384_004561 [Bacidia gigantensis]
MALRVECSNAETTAPHNVASIEDKSKITKESVRHMETSEEIHEPEAAQHGSSSIRESHSRSTIEPEAAQDGSSSSRESHSPSTTEPEYTTSDCGDVGDFYKPLLDVINLEALCLASIRARFRLDTVSLAGSAMLTCQIADIPMMGASHAVWMIEFSDGVKWIARVPGHSYRSFGDDEKQDMMGRIKVTKFIRKNTSIPMPDIFAWQLDKGNPVRVPYTLEEFIEGRLLSELWTDESWTTEEKRLRVLTQLARAMSGLTAFTFDQIGTLTMQDNGRPGEIKKMLCRDNDNLDDNEIWGEELYTMGPYSAMSDYLRECHEDPKPVETEEAKWTWALHQLERLAIDSIPDSIDKAGFALGHGDYNSHNILVNDDGDVTGIIDWNASVMPRAFGCARYPIWLTPDWDPVKYGWELEDVREFDSPSQLLKYRQIYAKAFAEAVTELNLPGDSHYATDDTKLSPLIEAIWYARDQDGVEGPWIILRLLHWAFDGKPPCTMKEYFDAWQVGQAGELTALIRDAFNKMWHAEPEDPAEYQVTYKQFLDAMRPQD